MKVLRWCLALALAWAVFEGWARLRFDLNNPWLPMGLRKNLANSSLEAHRLLPNQHLLSRRNIPFHTDRWGFRIAEHPLSLPESPRLILGGDSIAFGMYLPFEKSLGHHLQKGLAPRIEVKVSALPGGSQAMSHDLLFGSDNLAKQVKARWLLHSVNHYDGNDNWLYRLDEQQRQGWRGRLRKVKNSVGPYGLQMLQLKWRHFLGKDQRKDLLLHADAPMGSYAFKWSHTKDALERLAKSCDAHDLKLALFFMPDHGEMNTPGHGHNDAMESWAMKRGIPFLDLEALLEKESPKIRHRIFRDDHIHLTGEGARVVANHLTKFILGLDR